MKRINIYLCGVGGQGIGLLSEVLSRSCAAAGYKVKGCDTHGLAQRGGSVVSHLRIGEGVFVPRIPDGEADIVIALERLEAMRGTAKMLREAGSLIYYDAVYQPIGVRMGLDSYPTAEQLEGLVSSLNGRIFRIMLPDLTDPRMQNIALIGTLVREGIIEGLSAEIVETELRAVVPARAVEANVKLFKEIAG